MSSKYEIEQLAKDNSPKPYRFSLFEASIGLRTVDAPIGWDSYEINYYRHDTYHSVVRKGSELELTFVKSGRDFLHAAYGLDNIEAIVTLLVERYNYETNIYETFPAPQKISFAEFRLNEIGATVKVMDSTFKEKVFNREDTDVNILNLNTIEGISLQPFAMQSIIMPDTKVFGFDTATPSSIPITTSHFVVPILSVTNDYFTEMNSQVNVSPLNNVNNAFFKQASRDMVLTIQFYIDYSILDAVNVDYRCIVISGTDTIEQEFGLFQEVFNTEGDAIDSFDKTITIILNEDDSVLFQCQFSGTSCGTDGLITVTENYEGTQAKTVKAFPTYEAFLRVSQLITDSYFPFESTFFGRTDTPGIPYPADGQLDAITKGIYFREGNDEPITTTLKELFESKSAQFRLGLGVSKIDDIDKIQVEHMDYFFNDDPLVDLTDRLRVQDIEKSVIPERYYKAVQMGYNTKETDNQDGAFEFNNTTKWASIIKSVFTELVKVATFRADTQGIKLLMNAPLQDDYDPTKDVKGDDDIFMVDCVRDGGDLKARTDEGFSGIGGFPYANKSFNLFVSPARNFRRWNIVKASLLTKLNTYFRWQGSDKNTNLSTRFGAADPIGERSDIQVAELQDCLWLNEAYTIQVPLSNRELNVIDSNPNGLITLNSDEFKLKRGWILDMTFNINTGLTDMTLLRKNDGIPEIRRF